MIGSWRWNVGFGLIGAILTVIFSVSNNMINVVLLRSLYAFLSFYVVAYAIRFVLAQIIKPPSLTLAGQITDEKGGQLDLVTPPQTDDLNDLLKSQISEQSEQQDAEKAVKAEKELQKQAEFKPLDPPQFVSSKNTEPEELVKAIRHLTEE